MSRRQLLRLPDISTIDGPPPSELPSSGSAAASAPPQYGPAPPAGPPPTDIQINTFHAKLEKPARRLGRARMAHNITNAELEALGPAPRGPHADPFIEAFAVPGTISGRMLRWNNSGEHPLTQAWHSGRIDDTQYAAGEALRNLVEITTGSGKDSTEKLGGAPGGAGGPRTPWTDTQRDAAEILGRIQARMKKEDYAICRKFCAEGYTMLEALKSAGARFHKNHVTSRVCEALDYLAGRKKKFARKRRNRRKAPRRV